MLSISVQTHIKIWKKINANSDSFAANAAVAA